MTATYNIGTIVKINTTTCAQIISNIIKVQGRAEDIPKYSYYVLGLDGKGTIVPEDSIRILDNHCFSKAVIANVYLNNFLSINLEAHFSNLTEEQLLRELYIVNHQNLHKTIKTTILQRLLLLVV